MECNIIVDDGDKTKRKQPNIINTAPFPIRNKRGMKQMKTRPLAAKPHQKWEKEARRTHPPRSPSICCGIRGKPMPGTGPEHRRPAWETEREKERKASRERTAASECGMVCSPPLLYSPGTLRAARVWSPLVSQRTPSGLFEQNNQTPRRGPARFRNGRSGACNE